MYIDNTIPIYTIYGAQLNRFQIYFKFGEGIDYAQRIININGKNITPIDFGIIRKDENSPKTHLLIGLGYSFSRCCSKKYQYAINRCFFDALYGILHMYPKVVVTFLVKSPKTGIQIQKV